MKLAVKKLITILIISALSFSLISGESDLNVYADIATYGRTDDGKWLYKLLDKENKTVSIRPADLGNLDTSNINIPSSVNIQNQSYTVTEIASYAYSQCMCTDCLNKNKMSLSTAWEDGNVEYEGEELSAFISELVIPTSVIKIDYSAFEYCRLGKVTFSEKSNLREIGEYAFSDTTLQSIEIPASVSIIGDGAFSYTTLQNIIFEEDSQLKEISDYTFEESELQSVILPESITRIGDSAFYNCNLTEIDIPAAVTAIAYCAFYNNANLQTVNFVEDGALKYIRKGAFFGCNLNEVTIPSTVTTVALCSFGNNCDLKTVTFKSDTEINTLNNYAFVEILGFDYEVDDFEMEDYNENTSVSQINVENYDVYQWIMNKEIFNELATVYSAKTRVFINELNAESLQEDVSMDQDQQAVINIEKYIEPDKGYHFENSEFEYVNKIGVDYGRMGVIEAVEFISPGYPYVVIKPKQKPNKYEIVYDTNTNQSTIENTQCTYDTDITITSEIPTRTGYRFLGWSKNQSGEGDLYQSGQVVSENLTDEKDGTVTLYAVWEEILKTVTIHFSTPEKISEGYGYEITVMKNGQIIQQHDVNSADVGTKQIIISGAKVGETYTVKSTNYAKNNGQKKYYDTTTKEVTIN